MPVDVDSFPMRLFVASQERAWSPSEIDYSAEGEHWQRLDVREQTLLLRLTTGFLVGERGVTHDLAPLQQALRRERGWMEEEMYLTAQMYEEAKHVEFFQRWMNAALPGVLGRDIPYPDLEGDMFSERLPAAMRALETDPSPAAKIRALVTYHMIIEGVSAEASYPIYFDLLDQCGLFPALREGILLVRRDEARHIAFGAYMIQRLVADRPELRETFELEMEAFREYVEEGPRGTFRGLEPAPFGLDPNKYRRLFRECYAEQLRSIDERVLA